VNLDRDFYLVISELSGSDGPTVLILETELSRMDRKTVTEDLRHGQFGIVRAVIELNPLEYTCRDATDDFQDIIEETNAVIERHRAGCADEPPVR
jgi:hypothetical protein